MATIHLTKGAPKSTRLDEVSIRKRAATKGDVVVDVKPGEEVVSVNVGWTVEKFVALVSQGNGAKKHSANGKNGTGKQPARAKASANGKGKKSAVKTSPSKTSSPKRKKASKPAKASSSKGKKAKGKK